MFERSQVSLLFLSPLGADGEMFRRGEKAGGEGVGEGRREGGWGEGRSGEGEGEGSRE